MTQAPTRCYLLARLGFHDTPSLIGEHLAELGELARAAGMDPVGREQLRRAAVDARTFYGRGQVERAASAARNLQAAVLVCDDDLSGGQVHAITKATGLQVMDRTDLILTIFEARAQTQEARVQVELARCEYELPRLKGAWTHLERQVGGVGVRGGPGETQIEVDRRITRQRIGQLKKELRHLERVRETQRQGRIPGLPRVSLVGYTNAGKTSLLLALTGEGEPQDMLFATLDTTTRRAWLGADPDSGRPRHALVSDTVGFIRKLPHQLVAAFRSTLGEVRTAEALLVVADGASPDLDEHLGVVAETLEEIGCAGHPRLLVLNQVDRLTRPQRIELKRRHPGAVLACALTGEGVPEVREWLLDLIPGPPRPREPEAWEKDQTVPAG
ncbi:MAG: GTPase HflX [Acidobacteria bacterium]|nr:GTPase HflX [Acidobacteriota bacterium]